MYTVYLANPTQPSSLEIVILSIPISSCIMFTYVATYVYYFTGSASCGEESDCSATLGIAIVFIILFLICLVILITFVVYTWRQWKKTKEEEESQTQ